MTIPSPSGDRPLPPPPCPVPLPPDGRATDALAQSQALLGPPLLHTLPLPAPQPLLDGRDAKGRFAAGNPGKQPGTRHRVTVAMENLMEGQWEGLTKTAIALALRGDTTALRLCLDRIAPVRRGGHIEIPNFPALESPADVPKAHAVILSAVAAGYLTADEAKPLSDMLTAYITAFDIVDTAAEVAEIKRMQQEASQR
ncbi:hypothetical protein ABIF90_000165 [Bradyrhizobium japonicum]